MTDESTGTEELIEETLEDGERLRLVRRGSALEVWRGATRLFGETRRREDRSFAEFALAPLVGRDDLTITIAGLGTGLLLRAVLDVPGVREVEVIERSPSIVAWARTHFARLNGGAPVDPRVTMRVAELGNALDAPDAPDGRFGLILDLDESSAAPSVAGNESFYGASGVDRLQRVLRPGGVLAVASTQQEPAFLKQLTARLQNVAQIAAPVDSEAGALDYFYRARKPAAATVARGRN